MSDQDIIETIAAHNCRTWQDDGHCDCGREFDDISEWAAHIFAELHLKRESAVIETVDEPPTRKHRYVTDWTGSMPHPKRYRKKPVEVEAMQVTRETFYAVGEWAGVQECWGFDAPSPGLFIETLEGLMKASLGDWVIRGVKGEFYPCKPDVFEATYEPVERDQ